MDLHSPGLPSFLTRQHGGSVEHGRDIFLILGPMDPVGSVFVLLLLLLTDIVELRTILPLLYSRSSTIPYQYIHTNDYGQCLHVFQGYRSCSSEAPAFPCVETALLHTPFDDFYLAMEQNEHVRAQ